MAKNIEKWTIAQRKHHLSDKHVQMARELGLNPDKLGKIDNHKQEPWKAPLKEFIEDIYLKQFKKAEPDNIRSLKQILFDEKVKKDKKKAKRELQKQNKINSVTDDKLTSSC
jgi:hypothetical protein